MNTKPPANADPLKGKRIIVTGAGNGLGQAYAVYLGAHGAQVVVNDIDGARADEVAKQIVAAGGEARSIGCTVADWSAAGQIVDLCIREFGGVDGLVNNAAVHSVADPWLEGEMLIRSMVDVNIVGAVFMGVRAMTHMVEQRSGSIVNITSTSQFGLPRRAVYGATKGALASLTYSWAIDLALYGVRVNACAPQAQTAMVAEKIFPGALPMPADNAALVGYLLSDLSTDLTGQVLARRGDKIVVMTHPALTEFAGSAEAETVGALHEQIGHVFRSGMQPLGDPRGQSTAEDAAKQALSK